MTLPVWQRASLPMLILKELAVHPRHGYAIQALASAGLQPIKGAQLLSLSLRGRFLGVVQCGM